MEGEVINSFLPNLVTAVSDSVLSVSDQCLAKGLINETVYKRVLESGGTSEDKARTLILAVKKSTETDSRCLEILLNILEQELPFAIRENILSKIRKELTEKANTCRAVVPLSKAVQQVPLGELSKETTLQQSSLLGRFEDSIRQHEHACAEKTLLEERLKVKSEKCERLKGELETLKGQNEEQVSNTQSRITACTNQIENLKKGIEELQKTIEEQGMQARRGRNMIITESKKAFDHLAKQSQEKIQRKEEEIQRRENEHKAALREAEALATKKAEEEMKMKEREHKVIVQEKELRIRELEVESKKQKESPEPSGVITDDILDVSHFIALCKTLKLNGVKSSFYKELKWRDIGSQLGFSTQELDKIQKHDLRKFQSYYCDPGRGTKVEYLFYPDPDELEDDYDSGFEYLRSGYEHADDSIHVCNICMIQMLRRWLRWYPNDSRGSTSFPTYLSLKKALMNAGFGSIISGLWSYQEIVAAAKEYQSLK